MGAQAPSLVSSSINMGKRSADLLYPTHEGEPQAQTETSCSGTKLILHGCEVPGLLSHHSGLQPCPNRRILYCLLHSTVPANWWPLPPYGRMLLPQEGGCLSTRQTRNLIGT